MFGWKMQKYVYRVLYKRPDGDWELLTSTAGKSKLYTRKQDAKALIAAQPSSDYTWNSLEWERTLRNIEYKVQKAGIGEWQDEAI